MSVDITRRKYKEKTYDTLHPQDLGQDLGTREHLQIGVSSIKYSRGLKE